MSEVAEGKEIAGRYKAIRLIGRGGMGAVYEVEHLHTGQRLAMKVLSAQRQGRDAVERFKREARVASRIQSEHVVRVTDADVAAELDGAPFLVMELLDGADLERATGTEPAPPADVVMWLRQVARALAKAHDAGIVHRDLKPENLFLTRREDGSPLVKILDFGVAKITADAGPLTHSGQFLGTPQYMAPEQADTYGAPVTAQADVYAVGLIAFRLLMGRSYWKAGSMAQLLAQILAEPMPPASERGAPFGPQFDAWFERSCARAPEKRFASVVDQVEALAAALGLPAPARVSTPVVVSRPERTLESAPTLDASSRELTTSKVPRSGVRRRWILAGGAAAAAVAVAAVMASRGGEGPSAATGAATGPANLPVPASAPASASALAPALAPASAPTPAPALASAPTLASAPPSAATTASAPRPLRPAASATTRPRASATRDPLEGQY